VKACLLYSDRDFDWGAGLPPGHEDLIQDLELTTLLQAMAAGDKLLYEVAAKVLLTGLDDPEAIRYRQQVLADCLDCPEVIRQMHAVAAGALEDKRHLWGGYGGSYQNASSNLSGAVGHLEAYVARLRQLRQIADGNAGKFRSDGMRRLFATLQRDLDDAYFEEISDHLKQLRFRAGVLISARLDRDNSPASLVLRAPGEARRRWTERLGIGPHTTYSFTIAPRDDAGGQILSDLTSRGINLVAGDLLTSGQLIDRLAAITDEFPVHLIEDGLGEDDDEGWIELTRRLGGRVELVGDDNFCTNPAIITSAIERGIANASLIKLNQIGTVTETLEAMRICRQAGYRQFVSHRSGETEDSFIADLAVGTGCGHLKSGAPARGERTAKYNRLLEIAATAPGLRYGMS